MSGHFGSIVGIVQSEERQTVGIVNSGPLRRAQGVKQLCDSQHSQIVGFGDYKASTSRLRGSLHPRRASGVLLLRVTARSAKLLASLIPGVAALLYAQ